MSGNVSEEKRKQLFEKLYEVERAISTFVPEEERAALLSALKQTETELSYKHYGLLFEEHEEGTETLLKEQLPYFEDVPEKTLSRGGRWNFLLEGDNLASLDLLRRTHHGKIDFIYIDPPYNTGSKDFVYDDSFVAPDDKFRHSKWLSFIKRRLEYARVLLSERGVIFISIDDNEQAQLRLLCNELFGEGNYLGTIIWQSATDNNPRQISTEHEYVLCYAKDASKQGKWVRKSQKAERIQAQYDLLKTKYSSPEEIQKKLREWIKQNKDSLQGVAHYNNVDERGVYSNSSNSSNTKPGGYGFDILHPVTGKPCPKPAFGWRWPESTFRRYDEAGDIEWGKDESTQPHVKKRIDTVTEQLKSIYYEDGRVATKQLETIFGSKKVFNNPKTVNLIKTLVEFACPKDGLVLDFFAGSGTTGHAVMQLNAEDGGSRRYILCTNNENDICEKITYERLKRVAEGENYAESLKYFRVGFMPVEGLTPLDYAFELAEKAKPLVELEHGCDLSSSKEVCVYTDEEELFDADLAECKTLYLGEDVLLPSRFEKQLLERKVEVKRIPQRYYPEIKS